MLNINEVTLAGICGKEPQVKATQSGNKFCTFPLATNYNYKDKKGEWQTISTWHNIISYNENIVKLCDKIKKGSNLYLKGDISVNKYTDTHGVERKAFNINCNLLKIIDKIDKQESDNHKIESQAEISVDDEIPF